MTLTVHQIITPAEPMNAVFLLTETGKESRLPVVCLALIQDTEGYWVEPMVVDPLTGGIVLAGNIETTDYQGVEHSRDGEED